MTFYEYTLENSPIMARPDCHSACKIWKPFDSQIARSARRKCIWRVLRREPPALICAPSNVRDVSTSRRLWFNSNSRLSLKELTMSLMLFFNEPCPKCYMPIMQGVVDAHPSRNDVAIQNSTAQTAAL